MGEMLFYFFYAILSGKDHLEKPLLKQKKIQKKSLKIEDRRRKRKGKI